MHCKWILWCKWILKICILPHRDGNKALATPRFEKQKSCLWVLECPWMSNYHCPKIQSKRTFHSHPARDVKQVIDNQGSTADDFSTGQHATFTACPQHFGWRRQNVPLQESAEQNSWLHGIQEKNVAFGLASHWRNRIWVLFSNKSWGRVETEIKPAHMWLEVWKSKAWVLYK